MAITRSIHHWHGLIIRIGDQDVHKMLVNCQKMAQTGLNVAKWQEWQGQSTGARFFFPHWAQLPRSRTFAMLTPSRAVHDIPQWKNSCPASHWIILESRGECWKLLISSCRKLGILIFSSVFHQFFYTLMLSLKHFWTIFFRQVRLGKDGKMAISSPPRWRVWESQHRQHIRDPELLSVYKCHGICLGLEDLPSGKLT